MLFKNEIVKDFFKNLINSNLLVSEVLLLSPTPTFHLDNYFKILTRFPWVPGMPGNPLGPTNPWSPLRPPSPRIPGSPRFPWEWENKIGKSYKS